MKGGTELEQLDPAGMERANAEQAEEVRRQRERELGDLCHVMASKQGRRFVWRLLEQAGVFRLSFSTDPSLTAFNEGNRNYGLVTFNEMLEACPERFADMQREQRELKERNEHRKRQRVEPA